MASQNFVPWFVAGLRLATPIVVLAAALTACHKEPPHRAKRARPHPAASAPAPGSDDDSPPSPPVPAASAPVAAAPPPPPPPPPPLPPPHPRHQLTVDRSDRNPPSWTLHAAAPVAPEPAAAEYQAVTDKPPPAAATAPSSQCEGGSIKGERLTVQGVAADDVLNVRDAPDKAGAVLGALPHDATGIHGTANRRRVGASTWREVECGKLRGWVNARFLARETGQ
jgi:hypothetical protein